MKIVLSWTKLLFSLVIMKAQKQTDHICELARLGLLCDYFYVKNISKIRLLQLDQCPNYFKCQKQLSILSQLLRN